MKRRLTPGKAIACVLVAASVLLAACGDSGFDEGDVVTPEQETPEPLDPGDCIPIDMAVSSEKIALLTDLAAEFNVSELADLGDGDCAFVRVQSKASGGAMMLLAQGWPENDANGPQPVVWSPASSSWGAILNQRLADAGQDPMAPPSDPFMLTPLVIAMPEPMAEALGYPETPVGYADILQLAQNPEGWGAFGHPEWGPFRLGKTNPNFSTSALSSTISQYYAATDKTEGLTLEDLERADVRDFVRGVESSVVHYGDITMTFLNNWFRNDARGTALTYVSAVAVEEKSVIDYNKGNPDGVLSTGEEPREPRNKLVAIYPEEGTLYSDNPFIVLDAPWVDDLEKEAARKFEDYIKTPEAQERVLEFGFRPGNADVPIGEPISAQWGVDPDQPQTLLEVPEPEVLTALLDRWAEDRKRARVMLLLDVSGSMGEVGNFDTGETKLDLAKVAIIDALDQFATDDDVGLRAFTSDIVGENNEIVDWIDLLPITSLASQREEMVRTVNDLVPLNGTPLYTAVNDGYETMLEGFDAQRINAVVLLSDGRNEDDRNNDLEALINNLRAQSTGESAQPVRVFAIAYGADADLETLRRIAEATNAQVYDASDATSISRVFTAVVSNF